ncbi:MAG: copper resistance protein CopC/CopD, partial [Thermoleophilaceae bacterium]|nr:copper resistance protein CopC/CopD [Thermoleophilaceae bacterium]
MTLLVAMLAFVTPGLALAHIALKSSVPSKGAHLATAPRALRLTFTEAPELTFTRIELIGPDGTPVNLDELRAAADSPMVIVVRIASALTAGAYTVRWQIAGKDGHPVRGRFVFTIAPGAQGLGADRIIAPAPSEVGATITNPGQTPPGAVHHDPVTMPESEGFDSESALYVFIRWLTFMGILLLVGVVTFHHVVLGFLRRKQNPDSPMLSAASSRAAMVGMWGAAALGIVALLRLYAQSLAMHGGQQAFGGGLIASMLGKTVWGWGWLLQVVAVLGAVLAFRAARRGSTAGWSFAAISAVILAFTPALSGHASSAPRLTLLAVLADGVHVIGASGWLGSLLIVLVVGIPAAMQLAEGERGAAVAEVINAYSPTALVFAGIAAATGVFAAWLHIG